MLFSFFKILPRRCPGTPYRLGGCTPAAASLAYRTSGWYTDHLLYTPIICLVYATTVSRMRQQFSIPIKCLASRIRYINRVFSVPNKCIIQRTIVLRIHHTYHETNYRLPHNIKVWLSTRQAAQISTIHTATKPQK